MGMNMETRGLASLASVYVYSMCVHTTIQQTRALCLGGSAHPRGEIQGKAISRVR